MTGGTVRDFLVAKGFKREEPHSGDRYYVKANYYRVLYDVPDLPHCISNQKPPQIHIRETCFEDLGLHHFEIGACNEAPQGWIDFKFYSLSSEEVLTRFDAIQAGLIAAWRALFDEAKTSGRDLGTQSEAANG